MITPRWKKHLLNICQEEKPDAVLFMIVPLNHIIGIPMAIRKQFHIPALYFDGDLPTSLPSYAHLNSFKFNMYTDANLLEYDIFLSCSNGIKEKLEDMRVRKVEVLYYAADPSVFRPVPVAKQPIDIFYYGHRAKGKEQQMDYMIKESSLAMPETTFMVAGQEYDPNMGKAITCGHMPLNTWQRWCSMSKINLNITKDIDRNIYGSSSARPFELAAMGCCIVSDEYKGMQEWFKEYSEIAIVKNKEEAIEIYKLLLGNERLRSAMGEAARKRVLAEHTYLHRAKQLTKIIKRI